MHIKSKMLNNQQSLYISECAFTALADLLGEVYCSRRTIRYSRQINPQIGFYRTSVVALVVVMMIKTIRDLRKYKNNDR